MIHIIFVSYYKEYFESSLKGILHFADQFNSEYHIFIVNNNKENIELPQQKCITVLTGSNTLGEFSGWNEGLAIARNSGNASRFIFVNDTFNQHRAWTPILFEGFVRCFKAVFSSPMACIGGEVNSFGLEYSLLDFKASAWVSTYLFAFNRSALEALEWNLSPPISVLPRFIACNSMVEVSEIMQFSSTLRTHIQSWLSPQLGAKGWYGTAAIDDLQKLRKIKAISCEKYLSAAAESKRISINPLGFNFIEKALHKVQVKIKMGA